MRQATGAIFTYDPVVIARYPDVTGGVILARGLTNGPAPDELAAAYAAEQQATRQRLGQTPLSQLPALAAWRTAFRGFGVDPTQYRSAAEALLRRLTKGGAVPGVNTLVDLGNLVSIRYALPVAVFDLRDVQGTITVRPATGAERFTQLGAAAPEPPPSGEIVFSDATGLVLARRWCWRQSAESAARVDTTDALVTIEAQHVGGRAEVEAAVRATQRLLDAFAGGSAVTAILDRDRPIFAP